MTTWERWKARAADAEAEVRALYLALRNPRTPLAAKAVLVLLLGYAISPIDPIPDIIPIVGYLDEVVVLPVGIAILRRLIPSHVLADCRSEATEIGTSSPPRRVGVALTVLFWVGLVVILWRFNW